MQALIDFLLSLPSFQARLIALGWKPPEVGTKGGGGPGPVDPDA
jgi:hypothetical protein